MNIVAYLRVSTKRQGRSGLGLDAQTEAIAIYRREHNARLLATYTEVESGKHNDRPELLKAVAHAKRSNATLVVAKLDRLSRNVAFIATLMDSTVDFAICDFPLASRLTIHILAAVAEHEVKTISQRIKDALKAAKRRGVRLGNAGKYLTDKARARGRKAGHASNALKARQAYSDLLPMMIECRKTMTLQQIADKLNDLGHTTRQGKAWGQVQVGRVLSYQSS